MSLTLSQIKVEVHEMWNSIDHLQEGNERDGEVEKIMAREKELYGCLKTNSNINVSGRKPELSAMVHNNAPDPDDEDDDLDDE